MFEPNLHEQTFHQCRVVNDLNAFKQEADIIIANRNSAALDNVADKVYSRDWFGGDLGSVNSNEINQDGCEKYKAIKVMCDFLFSRPACFNA